MLPAILLMLATFLMPQSAASTVAQNAFADAERLSADQTGDSIRKAIEKYQEALAAYRQSNDRRGEAFALSGIGRSYDSLSEKSTALDYHRQALPIFHALNDRTSETETLYWIGVDYDYIGQRQQALESLQQALALSRESHDRRTEGNTLGIIGQVYAGLADRQKALEVLNEALPIHKETGNRIGEATALSFRGNIFVSTGDVRKGLDDLNGALKLYEALGRRRDVAYTTTSIGAAYYAADEYSKALETWNAAIPEWRAVGDRSGESSTLHNIGSAYERLGDFQKALEFYNLALPVHQAAGYKIGEANTLTNMGRLYSVLGEYPKALELYDRALPLHRSLSNRAGEAAALQNIGTTYRNIGDATKALDYLNQALPLMRAMNDRVKEADTLLAIGGLYIKELNDRAKAVQLYDQALALYKTAGSRRGEGVALASIATAHVAANALDRALDSFAQAQSTFQAVGDRHNEALALAGLARVELARNNFTAAGSYSARALIITESLRESVVSPDLRSTYLASVREQYDLQIEILVALHRDADALKTSESARARSLLDMLSEAGTDIRQGVDRALLDRERSLKQSFQIAAGRQTRLLAGRPTAEQSAAAAKQVESALASYQQVLSEIRAASPRYAAIEQPEPLTLEQTRTLLDPDTLLLEYYLGTEHSYLWAVSKESISTFRLPKRSDIEPLAQRVHTALGSESGSRDFGAASVQLSQMLLGPAAALLGTKRLVIVPDGALNYVPFGSLPKPERKSIPLIHDHEVVNVPSASTLAILRRESESKRKPTKSVAVIADPVFRSEDARVRGTASAPAAVASAPLRDLERAAFDAGMSGDALRLGRLIGSRREANSILALVPQRDRKEALDFAASRATARSTELANYRVIHFATHGLLNNVHPELSGLVLSLVNDRGEAQDGFLRLTDIYDLKLPVDMVVLSACQTGLGKEVRGEGLIGLTRGFMYAGASRVVTSLWKVDDRATSELMKYFYQGMFGPKHLRAAAALRAAQVALSQQKQWESPYYWAGFVLQGEWR